MRMETNWESKLGEKEEQKERAGGVWETEWDGESKSKKRKTDASHPAARGERNSWPGSDVGLLGVFIDLQDFNPQYWPKPLAEGC